MRTRLGYNESAVLEIANNASEVWKEIKQEHKRHGLGILDNMFQNWTFSLLLLASTTPTNKSSRYQFSSDSTAAHVIKVFQLKIDRTKTSTHFSSAGGISEAKTATPPLSPLCGKKSTYFPLQLRDI